MSFSPAPDPAPDDALDVHLLVYEIRDPSAEADCCIGVWSRLPCCGIFHSSVTVGGVEFCFGADAGIIACVDETSGSRSNSNNKASNAGSTPSARAGGPNTVTGVSRPGAVDLRDIKITMVGEPVAASAVGAGGKGGSKGSQKGSDSISEDGSAASLFSGIQGGYSRPFSPTFLLLRKMEETYYQNLYAGGSYGGIPGGFGAGGIGLASSPGYQVLDDVSGPPEMTNLQGESMQLTLKEKRWLGRVDIGEASGRDGDHDRIYRLLASKLRQVCQYLSEYEGYDDFGYDLVRRNCNDFSEQFCERLLGTPRPGGSILAGLLGRKSNSKPGIAPDTGCSTSPLPSEGEGVAPFNTGGPFPGGISGSAAVPSFPGYVNRLARIGRSDFVMCWIRLLGTGVDEHYQPSPGPPRAAETAPIMDPKAGPGASGTLGSLTTPLLLAGAKQPDAGDLGSLTTPLLLAGVKQPGNGESDS